MIATKGAERPGEGVSARMRPVLEGFRMWAILTLIAGIGYPLLVTALAAILFPDRVFGPASGGIESPRMEIALAPLLGSGAFRGPGWFVGRPSASDYDGMRGGATNAGPTREAWIDQVRRRVEEVRAREGLPPGAPVPSDLVTASGSGLDPHLSPESVLLQVPRVARERGLSEDALRARVLARVEGRFLGVFGEPRVNVPALNRDLAGLDPPGRAKGP